MVSKLLSSPNTIQPVQFLWLSSLISATRKLPTLSLTQTGNPFSTPKPPASPRGFQKTPGCNCKICKEGFFAHIIFSPHLPGRGFSLPKSINCKAINCVYVISCPCGLQYVGKTDLPRPRWANHKSHIRKERSTCNLAKHCFNTHRDSMVDKPFFDSKEIQGLLKFTILETSSLDSLEQVEENWRNRLQTWAPLGLNTREDGPGRFRKKNLQLSN